MQWICDLTATAQQLSKTLLARLTSLSRIIFEEQTMLAIALTKADITTCDRDNDFSQSTRATAFVQTRQQNLSQNTSCANKPGLSLHLMFRLAPSALLRACELSLLLSRQCSGSADTCKVAKVLSQPRYTSLLFHSDKACLKHCCSAHNLYSRLMFSSRACKDVAAEDSKHCICMKCLRAERHRVSCIPLWGLEAAPSAPQHGWE